MLAEALEFLHDLSAKSISAEVLKVPGIETSTIVEQNGVLHTYEHEVPPRNHLCFDVESLGLWCGPEVCTIWYSMGRVVVVLDDERSVSLQDGKSLRRNRVTLPLTHSEEWSAAMQGISGACQKKFLRWCLDHLDQAIETAAPGLLQTIRQVKFTQDQTGEGNIVNGKESFGKQINAEVAGANNFPDNLEIQVLVWAELDIHVNVRLALIIDPHESTFTLRPLATSKQIATRNALGQLGEALSEYQGESGLYCGQPS